MVRIDSSIFDKKINNDIKSQTVDIEKIYHEFQVN